MGIAGPMVYARLEAIELIESPCGEEGMRTSIIGIT